MDVRSSCRTGGTLVPDSSYRKHCYQPRYFSSIGGRDIKVSVKEGRNSASSVDSIHAQFTDAIVREGTDSRVVVCARLHVRAACRPEYWCPGEDCRSSTDRLSRRGQEESLFAFCQIQAIQSQSIPTYPSFSTIQGYIDSVIVLVSLGRFR